MDFVAIDFDTANYKRSSACSLGIAVVENNKIVEKVYKLIKPEPLLLQKCKVNLGYNSNISYKPCSTHKKLSKGTVHNKKEKVLKDIINI